MHDTTPARAVLAGLLKREEGGEVDERMASLWTTAKFASWKFGVDEPTAAQVNTVIRMCQDGVLPAAKVGREWRIDVSKILEVFDGK